MDIVKGLIEYEILGKKICLHESEIEAYEQITILASLLGWKIENLVNLSRINKSLIILVFSHDANKKHIRLNIELEKDLTLYKIRAWVTNIEGASGNYSDFSSVYKKFKEIM